MEVYVFLWGVHGKPVLLIMALLYQDRALWISLQMDDHVLGVLSVYAPTVARQGADFWAQIIDVLPSVDSWIVGGDFNNVECIDDLRISVGQQPRVTSIAPSERDDWDGFLFSLSVMDAWHLPSFVHTAQSLDFSWGFRRQDGRLLERLDRFYVGDWVADRGGSMTIWPGMALSDHMPVSLRIQLDTSLAVRRGCRIPEASISRQLVRDQIY